MRQGNRGQSPIPLFFLFFCGLLLGSRPASAGAWVREKGEIYSKITLSRFESDRILDPKGRRQTAPNFTDHSLFLYTEYGVASRWTAILSAAGKSLSFEPPSGKRTTTGLGDVWLHGKRALLSSPVVLSAQAGVKIPAGYGPDRIPPLGQNQIDWESRILLGRSFYPFPAYAGLEAGYRVRNGPFSDEIPYRVELGFFLGKRVLLQGALDGVDNRLNDTAGEIANFATRPPNVFDQEYLKVRPALLFFLANGFSVEAAHETVLDGGNTSAGHAFSLGLAWQGTASPSRP
jgi:protein XagA